MNTIRASVYRCGSFIYAVLLGPSELEQYGQSMNEETCICYSVTTRTWIALYRVCVDMSSERVKAAACCCLVCLSDGKTGEP